MRNNFKKIFNNKDSSLVPASIFLDNGILYAELNNVQKREYHENKINKFIHEFNLVVKNMEDDAQKECNNNRAYGGIIRAKKSKVAPDLTKKLIILAWEEIGGNSNKLFFGARRIEKRIEEEYVNNLLFEKIKQKIKNYQSRFLYKLPPDILLYTNIDGAPITYIECKAYMENAMLKRVLFDCEVAQKMYPKIDFFLFQLESFLGGDYCELKEEKDTFGSFATRTILSMKPNINLRIFTYLYGERDMKKPINKFHKSLLKETLEKVIVMFKEYLEKYL